MCWWSNHFWGSTMLEFMEKIQEALPKISYRFCYKNLLKFDFFHILLIIIIIIIDYLLIIIIIINYYYHYYYKYLLFPHIIVWFYYITSWFWTDTAEKTGKKIWKFNFLHNFNFQNRRFFTFHVINWLDFDIEQIFFTKISLKNPSNRFRQTYIWKS